MAEATLYSKEDLFRFTSQLLQKIGCSEEHASQAAGVLISADLRGVDSHGVARLSGYVRLHEKGRLNANPDIKTTHETPSTAVVDGDLGLGLVVGPHAMNLAIEKARTVGSGWVAVKNSNHYGIAGYHAMMALEHDCIGISLTNASPLVSPTFSKERLLGTNPISIAIPAKDQPPFVLDMATTTAANGKLEVLQRKGLDAPEGWLQDQEGHITTNAKGLIEGGSMRPLGGDREHGSHKGYALGAVVDILSAVLSGANYGPWVPPFVAFIEPNPNPVGDGLGHFFGAMRVDAFREADEFKRHMDNWIQRFRASETVDSKEKVLIPGDPEREMEEQRSKEGIPVLPQVVQDLRNLGEKFGVTLG
ncbi:MAG: Ldh family oxidoreductase [Cyclobacteriaceae bacterium]